MPGLFARLFSRIRASRRLEYVLPCLILVVALAFSAMGWKEARQQTQAKVRGIFDEQVVRLEAKIKAHLLANEQVLRGVLGLFVSSDQVERAEFHSYVESLSLEDCYPGIQGIGFAKAISAVELNTHIRAVQAEGFPAYSIRPDGVRSEYSSIVFLEPFDWRNQRAFGYDMYSEPVRREAMARARDTGRAALSGKVRLQQETDRGVQAGALLYLPVFKPGSAMAPENNGGRFLGWAYSPLRMQDLIDGAMRGVSDIADKLNVEIFDGPEMINRTRMYSAGGAPGVGVDAIEGFRTLEIAGRTWTLHVRATSGFARNAGGVSPSGMLAAELGGSVLLAFLAWIFLRSHFGVRAALEETAAAHQLISQHQRELQAIYDTSGVAIMLVDTEGVVINANRHMSEIFATSPEKLIGIRYEYLVPEDERALVRERIAGLLGSAVPSLNLERRYLRQDGSVFWGLLSGRRLQGSDGSTRGLVGVIVDLTERRDAEERLRRSEARYRMLTETMKDVVWTLDVATLKFTYCSPSVKALRGFTADEVMAADISRSFTGQSVEHYSALVRERARAFMNGTVPSDHYYVDEIDEVCKDGSIVSTEVVSDFYIEDESGRLCARGVTRDISERKRNEAERRIAAVAFESRESMVVTDAKGIIIRVNRAFVELSGYAESEVLGKTHRILHSGRHDQEFYANMWEVILRDGFWQGEVWNRSKDGQIYPEWLNITAVRDADGRTTHYVGASFDITRRMEHDSEIRNLAFYDPLTGLANRRLFADRLGQAFAKSSRSRKFGAVLYVDLDNFKQVNDRFGHAEGDRLLEHVADRLAASVREGDTVARFGGDEFVILLEDVDADREAALALVQGVAEKLQAALNLPYRLHGALPVDWLCSPSIGIAVFRGQQEDMESVLIRADHAMYSAKDGGRNAIRVAGEGELSDVV